MKKQQTKKQGGAVWPLFIVFFVGLCVMLYPAVSNWLATRRAVVVADGYDRATSALSPEEREQEWKKAEEYNDSLRGDPVKDPFVPGSGRVLPKNYEEVLAIDPVMCHLEIPSINVKLPVYHGVSEEVLKKGIGHIESTALPIGGKGGHTVLTGHTGLPQAKLFTDLIDVKKGDKFYLIVLGKELVYQVDQIKVIEPQDIGDLVAEEDKDYVTLITCTPYGVNSHRLLVRGERCYQMSRDITLQMQKNYLYLILFIVFSLMSIIMLVILLRGRKKWDGK